MSEFTNVRRARLMGIVGITFVSLEIPLIALLYARSPAAFAGPGQARNFALTAALMLAIAIIGIGLLRFHVAARIAAGLGFVLLAILLGARFVGFLRQLTALDSWTSDVGFALGNSLATTALILWLFGRALAVVADRPGSLIAPTMRLTGVVLAIVAATHLRAAIALQGAASGPWFSVSIDERGMKFIGFPGWVVWHGVLVAIALGMMLGPKAIQVWSARTLVASFGAMGLLSVVSVVTMSVGLNPVMLVAALLPSGILAGLAAWLASELNAAVRGPSTQHAESAARGTNAG